MLAAVVAAAFPTHRLHRVGVVRGAEVAGARVVGLGAAAAAVGRVVPRGDFGGGGEEGGGDAGGAGRLCGSDEGGGRAEDEVELAVDVGFDVDGVGCGAGVDEGDEDAQADAEHGGPGPAELRG